MSGHSKWATIKRAKAVTDAKRGSIFTKLGNIITIAVKERGSDPNANSSLRMAIDKARTFNMPKDNIERAIKRGTGELAGDIVEELYYEGILPGNVQFIIKCLTDNKNRSASVVRHALSKFGGGLGAVMWNFEQKGVVNISSDEIKNKKINLDSWQLDLIDAGISDFKVNDDSVSIFCTVDSLQNIKSIIEGQNIEIDSAEIEYVPKDTITVSEESLEKITKFTEELDELEDVSDYYSNLNN